MVHHRDLAAASRRHSQSRLQRPHRRRKKTKIRVFTALIAAFVCVIATLAYRSHDSGSTASAGPTAPAAIIATSDAAESISLSWVPVETADTYEVLVSTTKNMRTKRAYVFKNNEVQLDGLQSSTQYFIKVRGIDLSPKQDDQLGKFSKTTAVRTAKPIDAAQVIPSHVRQSAATSSQLTVVWDSITNAKSYQVQYADNRDFQDAKTVKATAATAATTSNSTATSDSTASIDGFDADTRVFVRVRAQGDEDKFGSYSSALEARTIVPTDELPLRVGSYNIRCHSCGSPSWGSRRGPVATTIAGQSPDVIGLQEAAQSRPKGFRTSQFEDLRALLTTNGIEYRVTERAIEASKGTRIFYKPATVTLLKAGSVRYGSQKRGQNPRYFAWAIFRQRDTGQSFFFASTHLQPGRDSAASSARKAQARQLVASVASLNRDGLPSFIVGDMNDFQYANYYVQPLMRKAGYVDPLGVQNRARVPAQWATVQKRINTNFDSFNDGKRRTSVGTGNADYNGTYLDYIFTSKLRRVLSFENVVNTDGNGNFRGTIPSDHNMLRADVVLPY